MRVWEEEKSISAVCFSAFIFVPCLVVGADEHTEQTWCRRGSFHGLTKYQLYHERYVSSSLVIKNGSWLYFIKEDNLRTSPIIQ
jgi:hypothetical protein